MNNSKNIYYFLFLFLLPVLLSGQTNLTVKKALLTSEILNINPKTKNVQVKNYVSEINLNSFDTLYWSDDFNVNFGIFGQDWLLQWFVAPADMIIKSAGFNCYSADDPSIPLEIKLVKLNWTKNQIINVGVQNLGYYPSDLNGGTAFQDNPDASGDWISVNGDTVSGSPFGEDLWSDNGVGVKVLPIADGNCQWVQMDTLGFEPEVKARDIIGIAVKNTGSISDSNRIGFYATNQAGIPGFKYYSDGRNLPGTDIGWWSREYNWDFRLAVDISGPDDWVWIRTNPLTVTMVTDSRQVFAYLDPEVPIDEYNIQLFLNYKFDEGEFSKIEMELIDENLFSAWIPECDISCSYVSYFIDGTSDSSIELISTPLYEFRIFKPTCSNLLIFNGYGFPFGIDGIYPQSFYFNTDTYPIDIFDDLPFNFKNRFDIWAFGTVTNELLENYTNVVEITSNGPNEINSENIRAWLNADGNRNYLLAGDEWLGAQSGWTNTTYSADSFQYDILGITNDYNDINYEKDGDQDSASIVFPVEQTMLGNELFSLFEANTDTMLYNPHYEIGVSNWLDGVDFLDDVEVFMKGVDQNNNIYNIGGNRILPAGNKIAFMAFDPISLDAPISQYYWYGYTKEAPHIQAVKWFGIEETTGIEKSKNNIPLQFSLSQNYPNPFNPATVIRYSIPVAVPTVRQAAPSLVEGVHISLKVYDILGKEVATLVNEKQNPGNYEVEFNASAFASGIYFYRLVNENFQLSKKMILLK